MADSPAKAILDTSIYLSFLRKGTDIQDLGFLLRPTLLYMSSVVFVELYAGARDRLSLQRLNRLYQTFDGLGRLISPDNEVWYRAARVLQQFGARHGFEEIGLARLTHDILIAMTARKIGATVFTRNGRDFERIRSLQSFQLQVYGD